MKSTIYMYIERKLRLLQHVLTLCFTYADDDDNLQTRRVEKVQKYWQSTVSVGDLAAKRQLPFGLTLCYARYA